MGLRLSAALSVLAVALTAPAVARDSNSNEVIRNAVGNRTAVTQTGSANASETGQTGRSNRAVQGRAIHIANVGKNALPLAP